jgi:NAD(P)-dependent dehydrogenase (short-subunit alcohol dehydrogenase family)
MKNPFTLAGKTVLITGASSGIGQSVAVWTAEMGANVILTARNEERLAQTLAKITSGQALVIPADLTVKEDVERLVGEMPEVDGAVLCAGYSAAIPVKMAKRDKLDAMFNINFFAPVELTRLLYVKKRLKENSSLVLIDSISGTFDFSTGKVLYGTSKAALNSFMKYAAHEYSTKGIRVNSICPGMVETPLIHHNGISDEQLQQYESQYPLGRFGRPEDIAYAAIYLLSDAAAWVTGSSMVIDGGITLR